MSQSLASSISEQRSSEKTNGHAVRSERRVISNKKFKRQANSKSFAVKLIIIIIFSFDSAVTIYQEILEEDETNAVIFRT